MSSFSRKSQQNLAPLFASEWGEHECSNKKSTSDLIDARLADSNSKSQKWTLIVPSVELIRGEQMKQFNNL